MESHPSLEIDAAVVGDRGCAGQPSAIGRALVRQCRRVRIWTAPSGRRRGGRPGTRRAHPPRGGM